MQLSALIERLKNVDADSAAGETVVAIIESATGIVYSIEEVVYEYVEDSTGATVWIKVAES